jgi:hypothetical protein
MARRSSASILETVEFAAISVLHFSIWSAGYHAMRWCRECSESSGRQKERMMTRLWHLFLAFCAGAACHYILTNPIAKYPTLGNEDSPIQMWERTISPATATSSK